MASLSAGIRARPPPTADAAAVDRRGAGGQLSPTQLTHLSQQLSSSPLASPVAAAANHSRKLSLHSEDLKDRLFSSSSLAASASASRSRHSSPAREVRLEAGESSSNSSNNNSSSKISGNTAESLAAAETAAAATSKRAKSDDKNRRRNKLRYRSKSAAQVEPASMEPPVLSFYGAEPVPLPSRFGQIKRKLVEGHREALQASWGRLLAALAVDMREIQEQGSALIPSIDFTHIDDPDAVAPWATALKKFGVGVVRGVVPQQDAAEWVRETRAYLEPGGQNGHFEIKPPPPQDPTCFDFFWTPAQIRSRAHPNVLRAMKFAMRFWTTAREGAEDPRMATRFPISYADRIRIHVGADQAKLVQTATAGAQQSQAQKPQQPPNPAESETQPAPPASNPTTDTIIAQVDGGSLERWEPDGYGRGGAYDSVFQGSWEDYNPWDPAGRVQATPDLYNGAGACSIFRMFQGLLALTDVTPGMVRLLPSPKLSTAYFLLRPFFRPKTPAPSQSDEKPLNEADQQAAWDKFLAAENWELEDEPSTIIHGAVPGHAQRVTELWHPHLQLRRTLMTPPRLQAGDYIVWHSDLPYMITSGSVSDGEASTDGTNSANGSRPTTPAVGTTSSAKTVPNPTPRSESSNSVHTTSSSVSGTATPGGGGALSLGSAPLLVYLPACPLTQTNALYLARQRKAFLRGHPGPDFDATGSGLGSEADHRARLGEDDIKAVGGVEGLRAMGLKPWDVDGSSAAPSTEDKMDVDGDAEGGAASSATSSSSSSSSAPSPLKVSPAELELVRLANIILFPNQYEFFMPTRHNSPDR